MKNDVDELRCPFCKKIFKQRGNLLLHLKVKHLDEILEKVNNRSWILKEYYPLLFDDVRRNLIWDYDRGEIIDKLTGYVVGRIYVP